jgi:hypothetical protein
MTRGPVALRPNPVVQGNKKAFDEQGRLRDQYGFLDERIPARRDIPKVPTQMDVQDYVREISRRWDLQYLRYLWIDFEVRNISAIHPLSLKYRILDVIVIGDILSAGVKIFLSIQWTFQGMPRNARSAISARFQ